MTPWQIFQAEEERRRLERQWLQRRFACLLATLAVGAVGTLLLAWLVPWPFALVCASLLATVLVRGPE